MSLSDHTPVHLLGVILTILPLALANTAAAQTATQAVEVPASTQGAPALTAVQIDQLVAPIALYPDSVLTDILAAATYPAQVVEAARFAAAHQGLQGAALMNEAASHNWDPSVQALLAFPVALHLLDGNLEWTDQLGRAFLTQQADVLDAIQRLRVAAERAGTLQNNSSAAVVNDGGAVTIASPSPQTVYLPSYDAACAYGGGLDACGAPEPIGWDAGAFLPFGFWQWGEIDWTRRHIRTHPHDGGWRGGTRPAGAHNGGSGGMDTVWHNQQAEARRGQPEGRRLNPLAQTADHYEYAPPAGVPRPGYGAAPRTAIRVNLAAGGRPMAMHASSGTAHGSAPIAAHGAEPAGSGGHR